jgi:hypothetical protein
MKQVYTCELKTSTNVLLFASNDNNMLQNFENNIAKFDSSNPLQKVSQYIKENLVEITKSELIFTDDIAPVEVLGQKLLNETVKDEIDYYKDMVNFEENGIKGILELLK